MTLLYNLGIRIYYVLVLIVSLFNKKAKLWINGRKGWYANLKNEIDPHSSYAWFHVSSLGEFEQGRPIIEAFRVKYPDLKIILTFFSPSGFEIRKNYARADTIIYLPLDTKRNAKRFVELVKPHWAFFIKYEYWYHFLNETKSLAANYFLYQVYLEKSNSSLKNMVDGTEKCFDYLTISLFKTKNP